MKTGKSTREAFGIALAKLGEEYPDIVVLDGDVHNSTRTEHFAKKFPQRFFNVGIAESNLVGAAAGMASAGKRAWLASFACFVMCNAYDQLRMSVAFPCQDVKVVGTHAGISIGEDGPSQMGIEDVSLACSLPNFTVVVPADEPSMLQAVPALARIKTPAYLRAGRPNVPVIYENGCAFQLGKAIQLRDGKDLTIIANGLLVAAAVAAAERLAGQGVQARVLDMHTVKPLDDGAVLAAVRDTGRIVVAEEHLLHGGLGSAVAMSAARQHPVPMRFIGLRDTFAESGTAEGLAAKYGLTAADIVRAAQEVLGTREQLNEGLPVNKLLATFLAFAALSAAPVHGQEPIVLMCLFELRDEEALTRWSAAVGLGSLGPAAKQAVPSLVHVLENDPSGGVRAEAARALGKIGANARIAVPVLHGALKDRERLVRVAAAGSLMKLDPEAVPAGVAVLVDALKQSLVREEVWERKWACTALQAVGPKARPAEDALIDILKTPTSLWTRLDILRTLHAIGADSDRLAVLKDPCQHEILRVVGWGVGGFLKPLIVGEIDFGQADIRLLVSELRNWSEDVRSCRRVAALILGNIGPRALAAVPALAEALDDARAVREPANAALERIQAKP